MRFLDFCKTVASNSNMDITSDDGPDGINRLQELGVIPIKYIKGIDVLAKQFGCRSSVLKDMDLPHIENTFKLKHGTLSDKMVYICERDFHSQSIPDAILATLSSVIYHKHFNKLSNDDKIIIKTLSMYLLLSNK